MSQSETDRETIRIANLTYGVRQATPAAARFAEDCQRHEVACGDCGQRYAAIHLDMSTGLCGSCLEYAGYYNEFQDGHITGRELDNMREALGYEGSD